jgi:hypothetical protein
MRNSKQRGFISEMRPACCKKTGHSCAPPMDNFFAF